MAVTATALNADVRYGIEYKKISLGPVVTLEHQTASLGAFAETGGASLGLSSTGGRQSWTRFGAGGFARLANGKGTIDASARLLWNGMDDSRATLTLAGSPATPFQVRAAEGSKLTALFAVAGDYALGGGWSIGGDVRAQFGRTERAVSGSLSIRLAL